MRSGGRLPARRFGARWEVYAVVERRRRRSERESVPARSAGFAGEILVTMAVILGLYLAYTLWWTNVEAAHATKSTAQAIRSEWTKSGSEKMPDAGTSVPGVGFLHVPTLGDAGEIPIVPGTDPERLNEGVAGYYTKPFKAAMPWEKEGNFSLAAHRDGHGAKFHNLDRVRAGDAIIVETKDAWYVYTVFSTLPKTADTNVGVIMPVPEGSGRHTRGRYITLTTCTPVLTSDYRLIVWGELTRVEPMDAQRKRPPELERTST
ncbi:class E sortase [Streptomyces sp. NPDC059985]|uniref:class E sortase n=1 Tax=Streptomyces sp. NPDC059985 TaxID=3347025 RepID=UPI0036CA8C57